MLISSTFDSVYTWKIVHNKKMFEYEYCNVKTNENTPLVTDT